MKEKRALRTGKRILKPILYMVINFIVDRGDKENGRRHGRIRIQYYHEEVRAQRDMRFRADDTSYHEAYHAQCEFLVEAMKYLRMPDDWLKRRPTLEAVVSHCRIEIRDEKFYTDEE